MERGDPSGRASRGERGRGRLRLRPRAVFVRTREPPRVRSALIEATCHAAAHALPLSARPRSDSDWRLTLACSHSPWPSRSRTLRPRRTPSHRIAPRPCSAISACSVVPRRTRPGRRRMRRLRSNTPHLASGFCAVRRPRSFAPPAARSAPRSAGGDTPSRDGLAITTAPTSRSHSAAPSGPWPLASSAPSADDLGTVSSSRSSTDRPLDALPSGRSTPTSLGRDQRLRQGSRVGRGQPVGASGGVPGRDGTSTGPHLHFEVRDASGRALDPAPFLGRLCRARGRMNSGGKLCFRPDENP